MFDVASVALKTFELPAAMSVFFDFVIYKVEVHFVRRIGDKRCDAELRRKIHPLYF